MLRWLLVLTLAFVSTVARAQSAQPSRPSAATDVAAGVANAAERQVAQLTMDAAALEKRYKEELDAIDRLKRQRPSWRRDREIRDSLSTSLETSNQLDAATAALKKAKARLDRARQSYLAAIEDELAAGALPARAQPLERTKVLLTSQLRDGAPRHILIPDLEIDPLADPEELDQRASELRQTENLLMRQLNGLEAQVTELQRTAQLRKHNERAVDLVTRYEDAPHRRATHTGEGNVDVVDDAAAPSLPTVGDAPKVSFEGTAPVPVTDVDLIDTSVDPGSRSANPAQRAEAARKAHAALAKRLAQVRNKRFEIEARAKLLRSKR